MKPDRTQARALKITLLLNDFLTTQGVVGIARVHILQ